MSETSALTDAQIQAIRERMEAASPGRWISRGWDVFEDGGEWSWTIDGRDDFLVLVMSGMVEQPPESHQARADGDFIAHAHQDIPALLAELERLTKPELLDAQWQGLQRLWVALGLQYMSNHNYVQAADKAEEMRAELERAQQREAALREALRLAAVRLEICENRMRGCHEETGKHELLDEVEMFVDEAWGALGVTDRRAAIAAADEAREARSQETIR